MKRKSTNSIIKHIDFVIIDLLCMQLSFLLGFWIRFGISNPFINIFYIFEDICLFVSQLLFIVFSSNYKNILKRQKFDECVSVIRHGLVVLVITVIALFFSHNATSVSRLQIVYTMLLFFFLSFFVRQINKFRIFKSEESELNKNRRSIVLVTSSTILATAMKNLKLGSGYHDYFISNIFLLDNKANEVQDSYEIPIYNFSDDVLNVITHEWVDEVLIVQPDDMPSPTEFMESVYNSGLTLNYTLSLLGEDYLTDVDMQKIGKYRVFTSNLKFATYGELFLKRLMDIAGGIVGCIITAILFVFIAPAIFIKSPGPIFFAHNRVGRNGRVFKMYKFRSMYMDAEERKQALIEHNKIKDGFMFKIDDDPRIIGSEKKDKNGKPKGIGNFIRNTSLDEFPQFWNVLKGEMSLVGTRPPTLDEWNKYNLNHRVRLSVNPGITGLWQVSGRSEITDFDEVVKLDREYLENWSILLDIKIILKTVIVVLKRKGAE